MLMHASPSAPTVYSVHQVRINVATGSISEHLRKEDCIIICEEIRIQIQIPNWIHLILKEI